MQLQIATTGQGLKGAWLGWIALSLNGGGCSVATHHHWRGDGKAFEGYAFAGSDPSAYLPPLDRLVPFEAFHLPAKLHWQLAFPAAFHQPVVEVMAPNGLEACRAREDCPAFRKPSLTGQPLVVTPGSDAAPLFQRAAALQLGGRCR